MIFIIFRCDLVISYHKLQILKVKQFEKFGSAVHKTSKAITTSLLEI